MGFFTNEIEVSSRGTSILGFISDVFVIFTLISICIRLSGLVPFSMYYLFGLAIAGTMFIIAPWRRKSIQYILKIGISLVGLVVSNIISL
jgi:hypothetical protein